MKFVDEAVIDVASGHGGAGSVHFMRAKYRPKLGPDGGSGGRGGHVYFEATHDLQSLLDFKFQARYEAENGEKGGRNDCDGRGGEDLYVKVPVGTSLYDEDTGELLADLVEPQKQVMILKGGRGGLGNMYFKSSTNQAPDYAQPGEPGERRKIRLQLKLMADVGLVGYPNAGKSTLISKLSAARPKVADYPFTTLVPNLGMVRGYERDFVLADIPGLIEGAHEGKGLGHQFLKHCERTRLLVMVLDLDPNTKRSLRDEYLKLDLELRSFSPELADKKRIIAINKVDAFGAEDKAMLDLFLEEKDYSGLKKLIPGEEIFFISAVTGQGLKPLQHAVEKDLARLPAPETFNQVSETLTWGDESLLASL